MIELYSKVYFHFMDYLLFSFGLFFFGVSFLLVFLKRHRRLWISESPVLLIVLYFFVMGLVTWNDFFVFIFNKLPLITNQHNYLLLIAYLTLFELGRRLLYYNNKFSIVLYGLPILLLLLNIPIETVLISLAFAGSVMTGLGLFACIRDGRIVSDLSKIKKSLIYIPFFILSIIYILSLIDSFTFSFLSYNILFRWVSQFIEWGIQLFFGVVLIYHILNLRVRNQFDYQLKEALLTIAKRNILLIVTAVVIGFFIINGFSRLAWINEKDELRSMLESIVSTIDIEDLTKIYKDDEDVNLNYEVIQKELIDVEKLKKRVENLNIYFYQNGYFTYGVELRTNLGEDNNHFGETYSNVTPLMIEAVLDKKIMIEDKFENKFKNILGVKYLSSYSPIFSEDGKVLAILRTDITGDTILNAIFNYRLIVISTIFGLMLFTFVLAPLQYFYQKEKVWLVNYRNILSSINEMICIFDINGNVIYANEAMIKVIGTPREQDSHEDSRNLIELLEKNNSNMGFIDIMNQVAVNKIYYDEVEVLFSRGYLIPLFISIQILEGTSAASLYVFVGMNIMEQKKRIHDMQAYYENTLSLLSTVVDAKDKYTLEHSSNVAKFAEGISKEMGLSKEVLEEIKRASFLHDIGKIFIPDNILNKKGPLNNQEWDIMKKHSEYGKQIIEKAGGTLERLIPYVYYHHERYDGKGYPTGMIRPPIEISVITLADAFDAMSSERSYRKGMSIEEIKEEISKNSGTQFHPEVVKAFFRYIDGINSIDEL